MRCRPDFSTKLSVAVLFARCWAYYSTICRDFTPTVSLKKMVSGKTSVLCVIAYTHVQHLFLVGTQISSQSIVLRGLQPQTPYACAAEVLYNNVALFQENKTVETDLGSEYITYIYTINRISVSSLGLHYLGNHRR